MSPIGNSIPVPVHQHTHTRKGTIRTRRDPLFKNPSANHHTQQCGEANESTKTIHMQSTLVVLGSGSGTRGFPSAAPLASPPSSQAPQASAPAGPAGPSYSVPPTPRGRRPSRSRIGTPSSRLPYKPVRSLPQHQLSQSLSHPAAPRAPHILHSSSSCPSLHLPPQ